MSVRSSSPLAVLLALAALAGCSGGSDGTASIGVNCASPDSNTPGSSVICLVNCNLGCSSTGCGRTNIAQNEIVILQFSEDVDPATVGPSSIRFRSPSGEQPIGEYFVNGNQVEFVPTLSVSGGQTFFGFGAGETYTMTLPAGDKELSVVRGTSGRPLGKTLTCSLQSTLGIVDLNGVAPRASLISPTAAQLSAAPRDIEIVLEFNEMIDVTPFLNSSSTPVTFSVRRNRPVAGGGFECDPASQPQTLNGTQRLDFDPARRVSTLSFTAAQQLPGNVCIEVNVTDGVSDLSGTPAQPQTFTFRTVVVPLIDDDITEEFDSDQFLDADNSAAVWAGGVASFARIGGDGRHGVFSTALGVDTTLVIGGKRVFQINTDNTVIPAANTTTGAAIPVTDGRFFFSSMVVPSDVRLRFVGANPPIITVAGRFDILGEIDIEGAGNSQMPLTSATVGQSGAAGGIFGGAGGKGGDKVTQAQSTGPVSAVTPLNNGQPGGDARLLAGHGYASSVTGSGGRGSTVFPASGLSAQLYYGAATGTVYSPTAAAGGGGGGFLAPGGLGRAVTNNHPYTGLTGTSVSAGPDSLTIATATLLPNLHVGRTITITTGPGAGESRVVASNTTNTITVTVPWTTPPSASAFSIPAGPAPLTSQLGPDAAGGSALQLLPFPAGTGLITRASEHFLVGGSGGGGSASQACLALSLLPDKWVVGAGGGGGGGAIALRAGRVLRLGQGSRLLAGGGSAASSSGTASTTVVAPAGGGSGGSVVMQTGGQLEFLGAAGSIDVRGGLGGTVNRFAGLNNGAPPAGASVQIVGGNGAPGFVRLEAPTAPALSVLSAMQPPATPDNVATLTERDNLVVCRSKFRSTGLIFGPEFARYEITGTVDGTPFFLSDDPAVSPQAATIGAPVRALFQAAQLDLATNEPSQIAPWRTSVRSSATQTGIASDGLNGFRFQLLVDYTTGSVITIDRVVVIFRV